MAPSPNVSPRRRTERKTRRALRPIAAMLQVNQDADRQANLAIAANLCRDSGDWRGQLKLILRSHNWRHSVKDKGVSFKTKYERERFLYAFFGELWRNDDKCMKPHPANLGDRHIQFMARRWASRQLAPPTIQLYFSILRTFAGWIGKPTLVKPLRCYFDDPAIYERSYVANRDKSWSANGVEKAELIRRIVEYDRYAGAIIAVDAAFGLRIKEGAMVRPHVDVVPAAQTGLRNPTCEYYLYTHRGTKGGRDRYAPIDSPEKWQAIEYARKVAARAQDSLSDPTRTLAQALRRIHYVLERFGLTKKQLGVTAHGLRHAFACDLYQKTTGAPAPVRGDAPVAPQADQAARAIVAEQLGHGRPQSSSFYLGSPRRRRVDASGGA
jgi:integrase